MDLKQSIELIHISATHSSLESRRVALSKYLAQHPEIDKDELSTMMPEMHIC